MQSISTFLRIRPSLEKTSLFRLNPNDCSVEIKGADNTTQAKSMFSEPGSFRYKFSSVFGPESTQEDIFEVTCRPILQEFLIGINGTIFAYGQTGSGKTFTVTGSTDSYSCRGLIPRSISAIFDRIHTDPHSSYEVCHSIPALVPVW